MNLLSELRSVSLVGLCVISLFFVVGLGWASSFDLDSAVIARGQVAIDGDRKRVQHLEGGVVEQINVSEGKHVKADDILLMLNDVAHRARLDDIVKQIRVAAAIEARLKAERDDQPEVVFDHDFLRDETLPDVHAIIANERRLFATRRQTQVSRKRILRNKIDQLREQIKGFKERLAAVIEQILIFDRQVKSFRHLVEKKAARQSTLDNIVRERAELYEKRGELNSSIAGSRIAIGEIELRLISLERERDEKVNTEFSEVQAKQLRLSEAYKSALDRISRATIKSPVDGRVLNLKVKTVGGVIRPGDVLMEIIPNASRLVIKARISPRDIDEIEIGSAAYLTFPSYPQRNIARLSSRVTDVSADTVMDTETKGSYYEASLLLDLKAIQTAAPHIRPIPGLPVEIFIKTGGQTLVQYIFAPVRRTLDRTFRES